MQRIVRELQQGREPKDAYLELEAIAQRVDGIERSVSEVAGGLPSVDRVLELIMVESRRDRLHDLYRAAAGAMELSDELSRSASSRLEQIEDVKSEIRWIMDKIQG